MCENHTTVHGLLILTLQRIFMVNQNQVNYPLPTLCQSVFPSCTRGIHVWHGGGKPGEKQSWEAACSFINRLGNRRVRVSVFGSKSCVFLAVCEQIWPKILGTYDLRSSLKYTKFLLIWSTESWETQLLKGKVTNPHAGIPSSADNVCKKRCRINKSPRH